MSATLTKARANGKSANRPVRPTPAGTDEMTDAEKAALAAKLTGMVGYRLTLEYQPNCHYSNEVDHETAPSRGHLWSAFIDEDQDDGIEDFGDSLHVTLDDRCGDVRLQFVAELRRIASVFNGMADLVEQEADDVQARYTKLGSYPQPKLETAVSHD